MKAQKTLICDTLALPYLERVRFFPRQLITPDDLTQEQDYFRNKLRRHNRLLHGWGVVCGARVRHGQGRCEVIVEPGYILGPYGDEIVIDREVTLDLCDEGGQFVEGIDPWCREETEECPEDQVLYIAVRYTECQSRPVRIHAGTCGCDEYACEYSRIRDHYEIKALRDLPSTYKPMPNPSRSFCNKPCPPCPEEPWVVLAAVQLGPRLPIIDCYTYRRYVVSFAEYYYRCTQKDVPERARLVGVMEARTLVSAAAEETEEQPSAVIALSRPDGSWVSAPVHVSVEAGDSYADFLDRHGDEAFHDPASGETYTLRELYALTDVDPGASVGSVSEAVAPLEGISLRVADLRVARASLEEMLDNRGLERLESNYAGSPGAAGRLEAVDIRGVGPRSALGKKVAEMTVADIAELSREDFVELALEGISARRRKATEAQASEVWAHATRVVRLSNAWRGQ
jgi:hypothetical protein